MPVHRSLVVLTVRLPLAAKIAARQQWGGRVTPQATYRSSLAVGLANSDLGVTLPADEPDPPPDRSSADVLRGALLDSRQRWRDLVALVADFAFETDATGRIVFAMPERILGWPAASLMVQPAAALISVESGGFDPFVPGPPYRFRRAWLKRADGGIACVSFSAAPLKLNGEWVGMRGVAIDVTSLNAGGAKVAAALHRGEVVDHILRRMRQEVLAPRMMQAVLEGLNTALGAAGVAVIDLLAPPGPDAVLHHAGAEPGPMLPALMAGLHDETLDPVAFTADDAPALACPCYTRFGERTGLCIWRLADATAWTADDALLASSVTTIVRVVLEHEAIQRELARQARTDPLTGLLNRRSFLEEVTRRIDRLDREDLPGTLMYVDLDNFKQLNDRCGHDVGDIALVQTATLLRNTVRPADLVARLGGDEFAIWLDGADELTAAERAERLRTGRAVHAGDASAGNSARPVHLSRHCRPPLPRWGGAG